MAREDCRLAALLTGRISGRSRRRQRRRRCMAAEIGQFPASAARPRAEYRFHAIVHGSRKSGSCQGGCPRAAVSPGKSVRRDPGRGPGTSPERRRRCCSGLNRRVERRLESRFRQGPQGEAIEYSCPFPFVRSSRTVLCVPMFQTDFEPFVMPSFDPALAACPIQPFRLSIRIASSRPSRVSGYIRSRISARAIPIDPVWPQYCSGTGLSQAARG